MNNYRRKVLAGGFAFLVGGYASTVVAQRRERVIGVLMGGVKNAEHESLLGDFKRVLESSGWKVGQNILFEERWTDGDAAHVRSQAADLVRLKPDLIFTYSVRTLNAIKGETSEIPTVFVATSDPVSLGFVKTLSQPGGNMTGFTLFEYSLVGKMLEVLKRVAPAVSQVALMYAPVNVSAKGYMEALEQAAVSMGVKTIGLPVRDANDIAQAIGRLAGQRGVAVLAPPDVTVQAFKEQVVALAARHKIPAVYSNGAFADVGGLMSYGVDLGDLFRRAGGYVDRVLRGEKTALLPVQRPTKIQIVINLRTARSIGLEVPKDMLVLADRLIS